MKQNRKSPETMHVYRPTDFWQLYHCCEKKIFFQQVFLYMYVENMNHDLTLYHMKITSRQIRSF